MNDIYRSPGADLTLLSPQGVASDGLGTLSLRRAWRDAWHQVSGNKLRLLVVAGLSQLVVLAVDTLMAWVWQATPPVLRPVWGLVGGMLDWLIWLLVTAFTVCVCARRMAGLPTGWPDLRRNTKSAGAVCGAIVLFEAPQSLLFAYVIVAREYDWRVVAGLVLLLVPFLWLLAVGLLAAPLALQRLSPVAACKTAQITVHRWWWRMLLLVLFVLLSFAVFQTLVQGLFYNVSLQVFLMRFYEMINSAEAVATVLSALVISGPLVWLVPLTFLVLASVFLQLFGVRLDDEGQESSSQTDARTGGVVERCSVVEQEGKI